MDFDFRRSAWDSSNRSILGSEACQGSSHQEREAEHVDVSHGFVTEGNEKSDELVRDGAKIYDGGMAQIEPSTVQQRREEVYAVLQYAASFYCLVEEWHD